MQKWTVILLFSLAVSCIGPVAVDYWGSANYYLENQSSTSLKVKMYLTPQFASETKESAVDPNSKVRIYSAALIGVNPTPADTFKELALYDSSNDQLLYDQFPINNSLCIMIKNSGGDYYNADFTLIYKTP
jgi:hypothetical protein